MDHNRWLTSKEQKTETGHGALLVIDLLYAVLVIRPSFSFEENETRSHERFNWSIKRASHSQTL